MYIIVYIYICNITITASYALEHLHVKAIRQKFVYLLPLSSKSRTVHSAGKKCINIVAP